MMIALYEGEETWQGNVPNKVAAQNTCNGDTPLRCPECKKPVTHRNESKSNGRVAHFAHCPEPPTDGCAGSKVGESETHTAMKNNALSAVERCLGELVAESGTEQQVSAPVSDNKHRIADALVSFRGHDEQLGDALVVEVQYKNKRKNIPETTADYIANGNRDISVLWLWSENFDTESDNPEEWLCKIGDEAELRERVRRQIWPDSGLVFWGIEDAPDGSVWEERTQDSHVPNRPVPERALNGHDDTRGAGSRLYAIDAYYQTTPEHVDPRWQPNAASCPATLPPEAVDEIAQSYKENHDWDSLFRATDAQAVIEEFQRETGLPSGKIPVTIPEPVVEVWRNRMMVMGRRLSAYNAERNCGACGEEATAYLHQVGFRCGDCHQKAPGHRQLRFDLAADGGEQ